MPVAFLRSPADNLARSGRDQQRSKGGGLVQEDVDQDRGPDAVDATSRDPSTLPADAPIRPMSEGEVQSAVQKMVWDAIEYVDQELSPFRATAAAYYLGELFGNEEDGRSQVVMTVLRDTVLQIMPSLLRMFFGADQAVEYAPRRPDQVDAAEQATDYITELVVKEDNPGFTVFQNWFQDALVKRLGVVKWWWDDTEETRAYEASAIDENQLALLGRDQQVTILEIRPSRYAAGQPSLYDVTYNQTKREGRLRFTCMPPEEFLFTRGARTIASDHAQPGVALFVAHRTELTRSQLLEMGVSPEDIEAWAYKDASLDQNQEEIVRQTIVKPDTAAIGPIATQKALYIEGYPYLDVDGDGVAELRKVVMLGPAYHVIANEPCDERPFAVITPDPQPHTVIGQGVCDYTMDLQKVVSMIVRSMNDSLALSIHPRTWYVEGEANLNDVLNTQIGAPLRLRQPGMVGQFTHDFVGQAAMPVLDYFEGIRESRTGITKVSQGLDADLLQSTTKEAVTGALTAAQQRIEMIARTFAEMGVKPLYRGLLRMLVEHQPPARMVKLRGQWVPMDPRGWDADLDVRVNVALGQGTDDAKYAVLADVATKMEQIFQFAGLANPIVSPKQYRDTLVKMLKLRGRQDAEAFFNDVPPNWQPPAPPPGGNDAASAVAQAEQQKAQAALVKANSDAQLAQQKHAATLAHQEQSLGLKREAMLLQDQRERQKLGAEIVLRTHEMNLAHQARLTHEQVQKEIAQTKLATPAPEAE